MPNSKELKEDQYEDVKKKRKWFKSWNLHKKQTWKVIWSLAFLGRLDPIISSHMQRTIENFAKNSHARMIMKWNDWGSRKTEYTHLHKTIYLILQYKFQRALNTTRIVIFCWVITHMNGGVNNHIMEKYTQFKNQCIIKSSLKNLNL